MVAMRPTNNAAVSIIDVYKVSKTSCANRSDILTVFVIICRVSVALFESFESTREINEYFQNLKAQLVVRKVQQVAFIINKLYNLFRVRIIDSLIRSIKASSKNNSPKICSMYKYKREKFYRWTDF